MKFHYSFNKFGRHPPHEYPWILGSNFGEQIGCVLSEGMSFETFTSIWSHVSENENIGKNPKFDISQFFEQL